MVTSAIQIDKQSKVVGFHHEALDHVVWQGYGNAKFKMGCEKELDMFDNFILKTSSK